MKTCDTKLDALCRLLEEISKQGFKSDYFQGIQGYTSVFFEQITHRYPV